MDDLHGRLFAQYGQGMGIEEYQAVVLDFETDTGCRFEGTTTITDMGSLDAGALRSSVFMSLGDEPTLFFEGYSYVTTHESETMTARIVTVSKNPIHESDCRLLRGIFFVEGQPRSSECFDDVEFLKDMFWSEDGEYDFAGLVSGVLVCHLKFVSGLAYIEDDCGERRVAVQSIEDVKRYLQRP